MIKLVGTQHSDIKNNVQLLEDVINSKNFDHVLLKEYLMRPMKKFPPGTYRRGRN